MRGSTHPAESGNTTKIVLGLLRTDPRPLRRSDPVRAPAMISCPICQFDNPSEVDACVRCGKQFTPTETPDTVCDPPVVQITNPDDPGSAVGSTPLPAPMIEPIAPAVSPPIAKPPESVLQKGLPAGDS